MRSRVQPGVPVRSKRRQGQKQGYNIQPRGSAKETIYLQRIAKVQPGGRARGRQIYSIAQKGTKVPRLSLNEALIGVGGGPR